MLPKQGLNQKRIQILNRSLVLNILRVSGMCSRADLARKSGLRQATITNIVREFIARGWVRESGYLRGERGRRSTGLEIDESRFRTISARITRKDFIIGVSTILGTVVLEERKSTSVNSGAAEALNDIAEMVNKIAERVGPRNVLGLGVAVPGPFLRDEDHIALMTGFPGWASVSLLNELKRRVPFPTILEHDANAGAIAEWWAGQGRGMSGTMVYVDAGQGVGAGIITNGRLFRGARGMAGEIGHHSIRFDGPRCECGNRGCLELYCSTRAILGVIKEEIDLGATTGLPHNPEFTDVAQAFIGGDPLARKVIGDAARYLATGLANVVNILDPDLIVIGDELPACGERFLSILVQELRPLLLPSLFEKTDVRLSAFRYHAFLRGMAMIVAEETLSHE